MLHHIKKLLNLDTNSHVTLTVTRDKKPHVLILGYDAHLNKRFLIYKWNYNSLLITPDTTISELSVIQDFKPLETLLARAANTID